MLFVCVHNAGRSQMAAALLDRHAHGQVRVRSAGSAPALTATRTIPTVDRSASVAPSRVRTAFTVT